MLILDTHISKLSIYAELSKLSFPIIMI